MTCLALIWPGCMISYFVGKLLPRQTIPKGSWSDHAPLPGCHLLLSLIKLTTPQNIEISSNGDKDSRPGRALSSLSGCRAIPGICSSISVLKYIILISACQVVQTQKTKYAIKTFTIHVLLVFMSI